MDNIDNYYKEVKKLTIKELIGELSLLIDSESTLKEEINRLEIEKEHLKESIELKKVFLREKDSIIEILERKAQMTEQDIYTMVSNPTIDTMPHPPHHIITMNFVKNASIKFIIRKAFNQIEYLVASYDNTDNQAVGFSAYQDINNIADPKDGFKYFEAMMQDIKNRMYHEIKSRLTNPNNKESE